MIAKGKIIGESGGVLDHGTVGDGYGRNLGDPSLPRANARVCPASGTTESRQMRRRKSDLLVVLRVWESQIQGEATGGADFGKGNIRFTQRKKTNENKIGRNSQKSKELSDDEVHVARARSDPGFPSGKLGKAEQARDLRCGRGDDSPIPGASGGKSSHVVEPPPDWELPRSAGRFRLVKAEVPREAIISR